jgi:hypothetical protein
LVARALNGTDVQILKLIDAATPAREVSIPAVLENCASLVNHHTSSGRQISSLAKYFIRALARQDIIVALVRMRRQLIPTAVWLDDGCVTAPDRLMGFTETLMPLLGDLSALAEDIWQCAASSQFVNGSQLYSIGPETNAEAFDEAVNLENRNTKIPERLTELRSRIQSWQPSVPPGLPFRSSKKFLAQASSYRLAALLYLYRLQHPPGSSPDVDREALSKAYDILVHTSGPPEESKMSLWPAFIAACEMTHEEDRAAALEVFDSIMAHRRTVTAIRTKKFCITRVWHARDRREDWNWMVLAQRYPGECLPI